MIFCRASRWACYRTTGMRVQLCTLAHLHHPRAEKALDAILWLYDGPRHCARMLRSDAGDMGCDDPLSHLRKQGW